MLLLHLGRVSVLGLVTVLGQSSSEFLESSSTTSSPQNTTNPLGRNLEGEDAGAATTTTTTTTLRQFEIFGEPVDGIIKAGKAHKLFAIVDFDRTLSRYTNTFGKKGKATHEVIQLDGATKEQMKADAIHYHQIEVDPAKTREEKTPSMVEWYGKSSALFAQAHITKDKVRQDCDDAAIQLRDGVPEFFKKCNDLDIPVIVMSAGLGAVVAAVLEKEVPGAKYEVVSNFFAWSDEGIVTGYTDPLIHPFNKRWDGVPKDIREKLMLNEKTHALVVGDSTGDAGMVQGSDFEQYKIGFMNSRYDERTEKYNKLFDTVLLGGGTCGVGFGPINDIMERIEKGEDATPHKEPECSKSSGVENSVFFFVLCLLSL